MNSVALPYVFARTHGVLIHTIGEEQVSLFIREDTQLGALAEVRRSMGLPVKVSLLPRGQFDVRLAEAYGQGNTDAATVVDDVGLDVDVSRMMQDIPVVEDLLEAQDDAPIIRMINVLLQQAVRELVSDIHIEPYEQYCLVRFRRDGTLIDIARPHRALHGAISSRIKIMAQLDIAEKRLPQDGRISLRLAGHTVDVRVSTIPTAHGERIVMRLLDKSSAQFDLGGIGMAGDTQAAFRGLIKLPHGIVLITGPTGSGKSTTMYAALKEIISPTCNIVTVEDPIEYDLPGVGQIQVNPRIELSFARALRSILRQDPDVIMIGEIRDLETAQIAVQASLTGHLVLATLHTNDAASAVTRLIDMGIEPFLLGSSLRGVLAQRLVRRLCIHCRQPHEGSWGPVGCKACSGTGYSGRTGIYELLNLGGALASLVHHNAGESELRKAACQGGLRLLGEDGLRHLDSGITSAEELMRVTCS